MFPQHFYTWMLSWSNVAAIHDFRFTIAFLKWWVRLSVKAILQKYLANIYQHERNINFIIIFLCWFFWWFQYCKNISTMYMNTGRMFPLGHWLLEQYSLNFPTTFENSPSGECSEYVKATLRQYCSNNQWPSGNILLVLLYIVQIFLEYCKVIRKMSIKI